MNPRSAALELQEMMATGIPEATAIEIAQEFDAIAAARQSLRQQATRESWLDSEAYHHALEAIPDGLWIVRTRFGEAIYDRYLYSSYLPNRLIINIAGPGTPPEKSGLRQGDLLISLNEQRIFSAQEFDVAMSGESTADILLAVQRGADEVIVTVSTSELLAVSLMPVCVKPDNRSA